MSSPEPFSFREYLRKFGVTDEKDFRDHVARVQKLEALTGRKLRLDWYDPFKLEGYSS